MITPYSVISSPNASIQENKRSAYQLEIWKALSCHPHNPVRVWPFLRHSYVHSYGHLPCALSLCCTWNWFSLGLVHETEGVVTSENYPADYPPNLHVNYGISVPEGYRIGITIDDMDIEFCQPCSSCDYLAFYDGLSQDKKLGLVSQLSVKLS